ncbi:MAG: hypothetical protein EAZ42_07615 [Verrucomicrobia bacterium]|nr:MAG: hypothetical protein EAZ42_07615 [Verrucomicrobiota bacterium]
MDEQAHDAEFARELLLEIARTRMPFGKYGPNHFPPNGLLMIDLPWEYFAWFKSNGGYPKGRLGELMAEVEAIKEVGGEEIFLPFRKSI